MPDIVLKDSVQDLSEVSAEHRDFYVEDDNGGYKVGNPKTLKEALKNAKTEREQFRQRAETAEMSFKKFGDYTPDKINSIVEENKNLRQAKGISEGDLENVKKEIRQSFEAKLAAKDEQIAHRDRVIENNLAQRVIKAELKEAGFSDEGVEVLPYKIRPSLKLTYDENGEAVLQPMKPGGKLPMLNDVGDPMSLKDYIRTAVKEEHKGLMKGNFRPGSGSAPSASGGNFSKRVQSSKLWHNMSPQEQANFISEYGREEADNLRAYSKIKRKEATSGATGAHGAGLN